MDEKQEFEMGLPNGVGEQMLAHTIEKFDVKLEHTEFGGDIELTHEQLINDFSNGDLHPMDLKNGIKDFLIEHFAPVREYMEE